MGGEPIDQARREKQAARQCTILRLGLSVTSGIDLSRGREPAPRRLAFDLHPLDVGAELVQFVVDAFVPAIDVVHAVYLRDAIGMEAG